MERKTDLRIVKTKKAIKTAFLNLLKENKYHNITISAISETALINRKTFYAHYETKDELYADVIEDALRVLSPANVLNEIGTVETEKKKKEFIYQTLLNWKKIRICYLLCFQKIPMELFNKNLWNNYHKL